MKKVLLLFTFLIFLFLIAPKIEAKIPCYTNDDCDCGYCCNKLTGQCSTCTSNPCPTSTPTPTPIPGGNPTSTPTPTPTSGGGGGGGGTGGATATPTPTSTPAPQCAPNPGSVSWGSCRTTSDCPASTSSVSCSGGTCVYSGNLKPCPSASCPSRWVPGGWSCSQTPNAVSALFS
jgi:hypothetical protein